MGNSSFATRARKRASRHNKDRMKKGGIPDENEWKCLEQIFMWATVVSNLYVSFFCVSLSLTHSTIYPSQLCAQIFLYFYTLFSFCSLALLVVEREISINNNRLNHFSSQTTNFATRCMDSSKELTNQCEKLFTSTFFFLFRCVEFPFLIFAPADPSTTEKRPFP